VNGFTPPDAPLDCAAFETVAEATRPAPAASAKKFRRVPESAVESATGCLGEFELSIFSIPAELLSHSSGPRALFQNAKMIKRNEIFLYDP
jgi:hypothetical protein